MKKCVLFHKLAEIAKICLKMIKLGEYSYAFQYRVDLHSTKTTQQIIHYNSKIIHYP